MEIDREELVRALQISKIGIGNLRFVPSTNCFIFMKDFIFTYNDQICTAVPFEVDFECAVPSEEFFGIVTGLKEKSIQICVHDGRMFITSYGFHAELLCVLKEKIVEYIQSLSLFEIQWKLLPVDFFKGLSLCVFSVSEDVTDPLLSCISVKGSEIVSSDNLRISRYHMKGGINSPFLIPGGCAKDLILGNDYQLFDRVCLMDSWVFFRGSEGIIFGSRILKKEYFEVESYFNFSGTSIRLSKNLKDVVERAAILVEGEKEIDRMISVIIKNGKILCRGEKQAGWIEIETEIKISDEQEIMFTINPSFFIQILQRSSRMLYTDNKAKFWSPRLEFQHLLLLNLKKEDNRG